jgi:hypothetical protein
MSIRQDRRNDLVKYIRIGVGESAVSSYDTGNHRLESIERQS